MRKLILLVIVFGLANSFGQQFAVKIKDIPSDLPIPKITFSSNPSEGYIFATVPYWGEGNPYLVIYDLTGKPLYYKRTLSTCTDFKLHENGLLTYYDYGSKKFFALDSSFAVVDSFWTQNNFITDEHDIVFKKNGNVLLIGANSILVDMSKLITGGDRNASVLVNVIQEITPDKKLVFEWKAFENYKYTDVNSSVNLTDPSFVHSHINSVCEDSDGHYIISARNLDEVTKINSLTGEIIWRFGGENNQFIISGDSLKFSVQHSVSILPNGNLLMFDNGYYRSPNHSRVVEYKIDQYNRTAQLVMSYHNDKPVSSKFWGNVQRVNQGNTFISWGFSKIAATEIDKNSNKVFEMEFPENVYSYRIFKQSLPKTYKLTAIKENQQKPDKSLLTVYPNPFNSFCKIVYDSQITERLSIKLYSLTGELIIEIFNGIPDKGINYFSIDANKLKLTSGIYFILLQKDNKLNVEKLLLIK